MSNSQYSEAVGVPIETQQESPSAGRSGSSSTECAEEEEQEEPSSSSLDDQNLNIQDDLTTFRAKWQKEISSEREMRKKGASIVEPSEEEDADVEAVARKLFLQGVENEQKGLLYEAIQFYKKAVQLVPDIEFKLFDSAKTKERTDAVDNSPDENEHSDHPENEEDDDDDEDSDTDLLQKLQRWMNRAPALCVPATEQRTTHISSLPMEILLYIFQWVVTYDLDIRSLEMCGLVSRGFYLCSRDSEIWRLVCLRLWGVNCGGLTNHLTWRDMYLERPHLNFSGCYISKTSYVRHGENSFQDQFYRPWHLVEYYRYLRFFPEGRVLMMTTPDSPVPVLGHLKHRTSKNPMVRVGHYRLTDDKVTVVLRREEFVANANNRFNVRNKKQPNADHIEQTFTIELQVKPWKSRINSQLVWTRYMVFTRRGATETVTNFEVMSNKFPPFWFSRVKSYCNECDRPLE